jgi:hypothetical protein
VLLTHLVGGCSPGSEQLVEGMLRLAQAVLIRGESQQAFRALNMRVLEWLGAAAGRGFFWRPGDECILSRMAGELASESLLDACEYPSRRHTLFWLHACGSYGDSIHGLVGPVCTNVLT